MTGQYNYKVNVLSGVTQATLTVGDNDGSVRIEKDVYCGQWVTRRALFNEDAWNPPLPETVTLSSS